MSSSASDENISCKPTTRRTSARKQPLNVRRNQPQSSDSSSSSPSSPPVVSNAWKQVTFEHAKEVEDSLLERCESYYQLMLQRLSGINKPISDQSINESIASMLDSSSLDLVHKCSRVGSRYQADVPSKLSSDQQVNDFHRFSEHTEPLIYPQYWTQSRDQSTNSINQSINQSIIPSTQSAAHSSSDLLLDIASSNQSIISSSASLSPKPINHEGEFSNDRPPRYLRGGAVTLGDRTLTRKQEYRVRYLSSTPAFPAFEFVQSKLCSPLSLKYRVGVMQRRTRAAEARLGSVRVGGRGRRSTRINPELAPPTPKRNAIDPAKQIPLIWERMLNTNAQESSSDGRTTLACMVHDLTKARSSFDLNASTEADHMTEQHQAPVISKSRKKQKLS